MKKAYLKDLQAQLLGSITDSQDVRDYFATDGSIFRLEPEAVMYPQNTADVRKAVTFLAARAEAGKPLGIVARGKGTDQGGAAVGEGLQMVFPAHMNKMLNLGKDSVTVQPGILYQSLQQTLRSHGRFLPPYPASIDYSTLGGAVANNAAGEKSVKYGTTRDFVRSLKVVLVDGSLIETRRLSARELNRRKGQANLEGEIYRRIDSLILDHEDIIAAHQPKTTKNTAGYALGRVRGRDGSFDLSQLIVGSQGTLGLVTEITLRTVPWNPRATLVVGFFDDLRRAAEAVGKLRGLGPSALELVDHHLLEFVRRHRPQELEGLLPETMPKLVLLAEFDNASQFGQMVQTRRAQRIMAKYATSHRLCADPIEQASLWKLRRSAAAVMSLQNGAKKALPFIEDGIVPPAKLQQFLERTYKLLEKHEVDIAIWGHAGDANLHLQPLLDLGKKRDVDKIFALTREFTHLVADLGGSTSGEHGDGLIRAPYLKDLYGAELYELMCQVKDIFDPQGLFNPGKKVNVTEEQARAALRDEYHLAHLYDHLPHT
ncbi:MAG TPA: FAD-binding oxidoreductase [Candidatus Saccharimonadia bacterium]|nr:FAD-binding oxidoreductase [Candidatus Saccharimonadia bacterium]